MSVSLRHWHKLYLLVLIFGPNIVYKCSSKSDEVRTIDQLALLIFSAKAQKTPTLSAMRDTRFSNDTYYIT